MGSTLVPVRCLRVAGGVQEMFYLLETISGTRFSSAPVSQWIHAHASVYGAFKKLIFVTHLLHEGGLHSA